MQRYYVQSGCDPKVEAAITMAGPQAAEHVPEGVRLLMETKGVEEVAVLFDHGQGRRIQTYRKMKE